MKKRLFFKEKYSNIISFLKYVVFLIVDLFLFLALKRFVPNNFYMNTLLLVMNIFVFIFINLQNIWFITSNKVLQFFLLFFTPLQFAFLGGVSHIKIIFFYTIALLVNLVKQYYSNNNFFQNNNTYFIGNNKEYKAYYYSNLIKNNTQIQLLTSKNLKQNLTPNRNAQLIFQNSKDLTNLILENNVLNNYKIKTLDGDCIQNYVSQFKKNKIDLESCVPDLHVTRTVIIFSNQINITRNFIKKFSPFTNKFIIITTEANFRINVSYDKVKLYHLNLLNLHKDMSLVLQSIKKILIGNIIFVNLFAVNQLNYQVNYLVSSILHSYLQFQKQIVLLNTEGFSRTRTIYNELKKMNTLNSNCPTFFLQTGEILENINYERDFPKTYLNDSFQAISYKTIADGLVYIGLAPMINQQQFLSFTIGDRNGYINTHKVVKLIQWKYGYKKNDFAIKTFQPIPMKEKTKIERLGLTVWELNNVNMQDSGKLLNSKPEEIYAQMRNMYTSNNSRI